MGQPLLSGFEMTLGVQLKSWTHVQNRRVILTGENFFRAGGSRCAAGLIGLANHRALKIRLISGDFGRILSNTIEPELNREMNSDRSR